MGVVLWGGFGGLLMKVLAAVLLVVGVLVGVVGCGGGGEVGPTADVGATVEAGVRGTREAEAGIEGTVAARVAGTAAALPTATADPTATAWSTATAYPTATPWPTATPRPTMSPGERLSLSQYADRLAGGPGAIYVGDLEQLAGPAVTQAAIDEFGEDIAIALGDDDGNVPLDAIRQHQWIYESDYYQSLLTRARLANPTELVSRGESIALQHTCINRASLWCRHMEAYFAPYVRERTNGQINIEISSFSELGFAGTDTMALISDGVLNMSEIYGGYVGGEFHTLAVQYLWGLWPDHETHYFVQTNLFDDIEDVIRSETGAQVLFRNWIAGDDQFFFSKHRLESVEDFQGLTIQSHSAELSDWISYMDAKPHQAITFSGVHTALYHGGLDASVTDANTGLSQKWYEAVSYMNGPLYSFNSTSNAVNGDVWDKIPWDLQQILLEEGAKQELEALRLAAIHNVIGITRNIQANMELVEFGPKVRRQGFMAARESVIPNWLWRIDYPYSGQDAVDVFNDKIGPVVGLRIEADGAVVVVPITAGPHAGRVMEWVLSE